jgi:CheY-like chemotaxis protein/nitrogen-specific signal transduction histidine kinase
VQQDLRLANEHTMELLKWAREKSDDLQLAHDQALHLAKLKSEFLSTMSHEIRTPMHAILGMIELLLATPLDEKQRKFAALVQGAGKDLLTLIDDILDTTKLEEGKILLEQIDFSPRALVEGVVELLKPKATEKGLSLQALIDPATPFALRGDPHRLRQLLFNFVGNALKFTPSGQVTVEVVSEGGQKLLFTVRDTGIGISESDRRRLLQPFTQADGSTARKYGGTGLGLFISNQLIGLMGGTLEIASSEGQGSAFRFSALFEPAEALPEISPLKPLRLAEEGAPVLLVEDNLVNQKIALLLLEKLGLSAHVAGNGREAIEMISLNPYRLVLMDCHLPVMDGFQTTANIRSKEGPSGQRLPIIALTANTLEVDRERCLAAGMDGFLSKPFDLRQLQGVLKDWLNWGEENPEKKASQIPLQISELQEVCRGDEAVLLDLLKFFLVTTKELVEELKSAVEKKDLASLIEHAHTLKGACASMTAREMASLCKEIEQEAKSGQADLLPGIMRKLDGSFERVGVFLEEVLPHVGE